MIIFVVQKSGDETIFAPLSKISAGFRSFWQKI